MVELLVTGKGSEVGISHTHEDTAVDVRVLTEGFQRL